MICKYPDRVCIYKASKICENGKTKDVCELFDNDRCLFDDSESYNEYLKTTTSTEKTCNHPEKYCYLRKENGTCGNKFFNCQNDYMTNTFTHVNNILCKHQLYTCTYRQCGYCTYKGGKECIFGPFTTDNSINYTIDSIDDEVKKKYENTVVTVNDDIKYRISGLINKFEELKKTLINPSNITIVDKIIKDIKNEFPEIYPEVMTKDKAIDIIRHKEKYSARELWNAKHYILDEIVNGADLVKPKNDISED